MHKAHKSRAHLATLNAVSNLALQIVTILSGLIIPRLILNSLGSEVNGLVSSLTQFLNVSTLLEGGLSLAVMARLYRPLHENNSQKISAVVRAAQKCYRQLAIIFISYALCVSIIYPIVRSSAFTFEYICSLALILAFATFIQYNFAISLQLLLRADRKVYITSAVQIATNILNIAVAIIVMNVCPDVHILKLAIALVYLIQPLFYSLYAKKHYAIDKNVTPDRDLLQNRWDGFGINVAAFIHYNADVIILTLLTNLPTVSIYSVYLLVTTGLRKLTTSISGGIIPSLGKIHASDDQKELHRFFGKYEFVLFFITFLLFTVGSLLITPFVSLYTSGITDANYYQPIFGVLIIIAEAICCLRDPYINMAYSSGHLRDITKYTFIEAGINVIISLALVPSLGLIGVAIGTICAMTYRLLFQVFYLPKIIPARTPKYFFRTLARFSVPTLLGLLLCAIFDFFPAAVTLESWIFFGFSYVALFGGLYVIFNVKQLQIYFKKSS